MKCLTAFFLLVVCPLSLSAADVFERHLARHLKQAAEQSSPLPRLSMDEAARLKSLSATVSSPCLIVHTDDGNWTKVLVGWGFRKGPEKPTPVLLLERYVTYRGDRPELTAATGKDVMLFAGFAFNFDIGQVVPQGQGADIEFTADGVLKPVGDAELYALNGSVLPPPEKNGKASATDHEGVLPRDFAGTWKVNADRWQGEWELRVEANGRATGTYTSADTKNVYDITGQVANLPHNLHLEVQLANASQSIDAFLWTTDKSTMAGTLSLAGRKFGFYATRVEE